jgi:hypothetical protein
MQVIGLDTWRECQGIDCQGEAYNGNQMEQEGKEDTTKGGRMA